MAKAAHTAHRCSKLAKYWAAVSCRWANFFLSRGKGTQAQPHQAEGEWKTVRARLRNGCHSNPWVEEGSWVPHTHTQSSQVGRKNITYERHNCANFFAAEQKPHTPPQKKTTHMVQPMDDKYVPHVILYKLAPPSRRQQGI